MVRIRVNHCDKDGDTVWSFVVGWGGDGDGSRVSVTMVVRADRRWLLELDFKIVKQQIYDCRLLRYILCIGTLVVQLLGRYKLHWHIVYRL